MASPQPRLAWEGLRDIAKHGPDLNRRRDELHDTTEHRPNFGGLRERWVAQHLNVRVQVAARRTIPLTAL